MLTSINLNTGSKKQFTMRTKNSAPRARSNTIACPSTEEDCFFLGPKSMDQTLFTEQILEEIRVGSSKLVFFNVCQTISKKKVTLCISSDGICILPSKTAGRLTAFHGWEHIRKFLTPDGSSTSYQEDPAGYVLVYNGKDLQYMFNFDTFKERHLFINIVTRFANEFVENERKRKQQKTFQDRSASPGLRCDSPTLAADAIRERRKTRRSSSHARSRPLEFGAEPRKTLKFEEEAIQQVRERSNSLKHVRVTVIDSNIVENRIE